MIHFFLKKDVFIKSICLMKRIAFLKWKLLPGFAGIISWLEHINTKSVQEPNPVAAITYFCVVSEIG